MKVIIIEDESAALDSIKNILADIDSSIEVIGCFDTVAGSVKWFKENHVVDVVFMDIELADGSAFNIFECITIDAPIIFTTAYDRYAIDAFRVNSIDYILKPVTMQSVKEAFMKLNRINKIQLEVALANVGRMLHKSEYSKRILIVDKDKIFPIKIEDVVCFYNTNRTTEVYTTFGDSYKIDRSLDSIFMNLDPAIFFRANRQFIVSKNYILNITLWFDSRLLLNLIITIQEKIYVSKNRAADFKKWFSL